MMDKIEELQSIITKAKGYALNNFNRSIELNLVLDKLDGAELWIGRLEVMDDSKRPIFEIDEDQD
jgi:hypothetical protein